jgi:hypothetical protein
MFSSAEAAEQTAVAAVRSMVADRSVIRIRLIAFIV